MACKLCPGVSGYLTGWPAQRPRPITRVVASHSGPTDFYTWHSNCSCYQGVQKKQNIRGRGNSQSKNKSSHITNNNLHARRY